VPSSFFFGRDRQIDRFLRNHSCRRRPWSLRRLKYECISVLYILEVFIFWPERTLITSQLYTIYIYI
jgi:hypothetical protein